MRDGSKPARGFLFVAGGAFVFLLPPLGPLDDRFIPALVEVGAAGWMLTVLGMLFAIWARVTLGRNWSAKVVIRQGQQLVTTGPYALARHPIYTGLLAAIAGTALYDGRWRALLGLAFFSIGFWLKARSEEDLLKGEFGEEHRAYRARTPMLMPRLHRPPIAAPRS
jgi:protein-S-isoprenylcysteine O-methyltransferase Ste14